MSIGVGDSQFLTKKAYMFLHNYTERGNPAYAGTPQRKIRPVSSSGDEGHADGVDDITPPKTLPEEDELSWRYTM